MTLFDSYLKVEQDPVLGEDTFELFETIEDSFGVNLDDYHQYLGLTVKELAEEIAKRANYPTKETCLSMVSFYKLRRAFSSSFDIPRTAIRPTTLLVELLPWKDRRSRWNRIQSGVGLTLPKLVYPRWLLYLSLAVPATLLICLRAIWGVPLNAIAILFGSILFIIPAIIAFSPLARSLPPGSETFGDLVKVVLARNPFLPQSTAVRLTAMYYRLCVR